MAQTINTNIASLTAQRNLNKSQNSLATAMQRLSSGLRINSAKDDAAGLAIAERMTTQIRGMNQAIRNANDGISLSQTAEGAMEEISNNMQRIRELAVQARNATNNTSDREALNAEVQQRLNEIDRIATQTKFNGTSLLDGSFTSKVFQVGADVGQTISIDEITDAQALSLGLDGTVGAATALGTNAAAITAGTININGEDVTTTLAGPAALVAAITSADNGVTAAATNSATVALGGFTTVTSAVAGTYLLEVDGVTVADQDPVHLTNDYVAADLQAHIDAAVAATGTGTLADKGITVSGTVAAGNLVFTKADGTSFDVTETLGGDATGAGLAGLTDGVALGSDRAVITLTSESDIIIASGDTTGSGFTAGTAAATYSDTGALMDVLTSIGADNAITKIDAALSTVSGARAAMGAVQSRFESAITSLSVTVENVSAARSRIQDADFAAETAAMTRAQILQQAGVAMVSQANAMPSNVLSLLQ